MASDNTKNRKYLQQMISSQDDHEEKGGEGGKGGKSGEIGFKVKTEISRDDLLAPAEITRLLAAHKDLHKAYIDKQKALRKERTALKEGRKNLTAQHRTGFGLGGGGSRSQFKQHPINRKAQFSGIDKQVSNLPTEFDAETNMKQQNDLENRYTHTHRYQPTRTFNPRPRGPY